LVETSINNANPDLKKIYRNKFNKIADIIEEEVDFEDINLILKELVQS
jgi:hypothetical protein